MAEYKKRTGSLRQESPDQRPEAGPLASGPLTRRDSPFWRDLRVLLASKLYAAERLSSERAARLAGINHIEFLLSLGFYKVFPLQAELNELECRHE